MNFINKLFVSKSEVSSKRFVGIFSFIAIVAISFINMFCGLSLQPFMFDGLLWLCLGSFGLTSVEKFKGDNKSENI